MSIACLVYALAQNTSRAACYGPSLSRTYHLAPASPHSIASDPLPHLLVPITLNRELGEVSDGFCRPEIKSRATRCRCEFYGTLTEVHHCLNLEIVPYTQALIIICSYTHRSRNLIV